MTSTDDSVSLREYLEQLFEAHYLSHREHAAAHDREHHDAQTAIDKSEGANREWRLASNEWRAAMSDREIQFATKADVLSIVKRIDDLVEQSRTRLGDMDKAAILRDERDRQRLASEAEEKRQDERRQSRQQWTVGVIVTIVSISVGILLRFVH